MSLLDFTGKVKIVNGIYYFEMGKKIDPLKCSTPTEVRNPVIDSTFKYVFLQNEEIIKNLLNSVIFTGEDEIKKLNYTRNEFPMLTGGKYGKDIKRIDVGVICKMGKKGNKERFISLNINEKYASTILLEMQIDIFEQDYSERFIGYATQIYASEKVDKVYVIALVLNPKKYSRGKSKSSKTFFIEKSIPKFTIIKEYDYLTIIKIDLNYCYKLLTENKGIWILNSENILNRSGEEWIKYLTIPLWCDSAKGYHQFPNIVEKNFVENKYVREALLILSNKNNDAFKKYYDEWSMYEIEKKLIEKDEIIFEKDEILSEKDEEIKRLKQENAKIKEEIMKLKEKKPIFKSPKSKSSKYQKKSKKTSAIKTKKIKYPKKEIDDEEEESEKEEGEGEGEEEGEGEGEGEEEENRDSDYYPDKEDLEEEEKKEEDKDDDNSNKEEDMDIE